jgi:DNA-binding transcriptional ArsR family regulator
VQYQLTKKQNLANEEFDEKAQLHQTSVNLRYARAIKTTLNTQFSHTFIDYNGLVNSPTGYEMLQALTPGHNYIWSINWLQKIGEGLQLNMVYEGRNSEGLQRVVHTGRKHGAVLAHRSHPHPVGDGRRSQGVRLEQVVHGALLGGTGRSGSYDNLRSTVIVKLRHLSYYGLVSSVAPSSTVPGRVLDHPAREEIRLEGVLHALADPMRLHVVRVLAGATSEVPCGEIELAVSKSTCTHHFRVLREAGVISQCYQGTAKLNRLRREDLDSLFPGLLDSVLAATSDRE